MVAQQHGSTVTRHVCAMFGNVWGVKRFLTEAIDTGRPKDKEGDGCFSGTNRTLFASEKNALITYKNTEH